MNNPFSMAFGDTGCAHGWSDWKVWFWCLQRSRFTMVYMYIALYSHQWTPIVQERASSEHERVTSWHFSNEASDANYPIEDIEGYWRHQKTSKKASSQPEAHVLHFVPSLQYRDEHVLEIIQRVVILIHGSTVVLWVLSLWCVPVTIPASS